MSADARLATYLNDHLAGSVAGIELGERLRDAAGDDAASAELARLVEEIREDQDVLRDLLARLGAGESATKRSMAWLGEKLGHLKLAPWGAGPAGAALGRLEQLEVLMLGVRGKLALWDALSAVRGGDGRFADVEWATLARRAADQIDRIDRLRVKAAREALGSAVD